MMLKTAMMDYLIAMMTYSSCSICFSSVSNYAFHWFQTIIKRILVFRLIFPDDTMRGEFVCIKMVCEYNDDAISDIFI